MVAASVEAEEVSGLSESELGEGEGGKGIVNGFQCDPDFGIANADRPPQLARAIDHDKELADALTEQAKFIVGWVMIATHGSANPTEVRWSLDTAIAALRSRRKHGAAPMRVLP